MNSSDDYLGESLCIVIPTYDGSAYLGPLLAALTSQTSDGRQLEILIINSGPDAASAQIARRHKQTRFHVIDKKLFSHSATRNLAVSMTVADYIVFMTQDATPRDAEWLSELLRPLTLNPNVAASYSRQIPRPGCNPLESRDIYSGAPAVDEIRWMNPKNPRHQEDYSRNFYRNIRFSNVSACYRGSLLRKYPFDEKLVMVEDQAWSKRIIERGHAIYYASKSIVFHSHDWKIRQVYRRQYDYGRSFRRFALSPQPPVSWKTFFAHVSADIIFILRGGGSLIWKIRWILRSPTLRLGFVLGFYRGWKHG